jgi:hypothetical protein
MMPKAGRLALIKSVLAAIPLHQLMVLSMDKKTLKKIEQILRGFLWVARAEANGTHDQLTWQWRFGDPCPGPHDDKPLSMLAAEDVYQPL